MVPEGWKKGVIEDIANVSSGGTPSRKKDSYWSGNIPWVTTAEVKYGVIKDTEQKITEEGLKNSSAKLFPKNTILMAMYGQGKTRGQVAKLGIEASTNQACAALLLKSGFSVDYYYQYLVGQYENIRELANSGGQQNLSSGIIKGIHVPIPPLPEQQKIARILSTWDKAIANTEKRIDNSKQQRKALKQQLLTGKKRFPGFEGEWDEVAQGAVAKFYNGRAYKKTEWEEQGTPVIRLQNLTGRGADFYYSKLELPEHQYCDSDDLLYMWSATFGPSIWRGNKAIYHYHIWKVECDPKMLNKHYMYYLLDFETQKWMSQSNGMGLLHITKTTMEKQIIGLPEILEQQKIAKVLTNADREIELLEQQLADLKQEKKALMQQLLTGKRRVKVDEAEVA